MDNSEITYNWDEPLMQYDVPVFDTYSKNINGNTTGLLHKNKLGMFVLFGMISLSIEASPATITYQKPDVGIQMLVEGTQDITFDEVLQLTNQWKEETTRLAALQENWDNEGANRISTKSIANVLSILDNNLSRPDLISDIYPNQNGFVSIEWRNSSNDIIGLEVGRHMMSYFTNIHNTSNYYNRLDINDVEMQKLFKRLKSL